MHACVAPQDNVCRFESFLQSGTRDGACSTVRAKQRSTEEHLHGSAHFYESVYVRCFGWVANKLTLKIFTAGAVGGKRKRVGVRGPVKRINLSGAGIEI